MNETPSNVENHEQGGYKEKIIEAIKIKDKVGLISVLENVNIALTGDFSTFMNQIDRHEREIDEFFDSLKNGGLAAVIIYLGDGGISRLVLRSRDNEITVEPSPVSSEKVKQRWEELQ